MALQKIKLSNGKIREVQDHLAFDKALQKQQGFTPCDDNGIPLPAGTQEKKARPGTILLRQIIQAHYR